MAKQIKRLIALLVASVMCFSLICMPTYASGEQEKHYLDFETNDPASYFAAIDGWNMSGTKNYFTIHEWTDENADVWGKSLKYTNGPNNEQARINLGDWYNVVGCDFSFRFDSVSNNVLLSFRQEAGDLYVVTLGADQTVKVFEESVTSYEVGKWYDISIVFSNSKKFAIVKFKPSDSDEWEVFEKTYTGTKAVATNTLLFDIYGGAQGDNGEKFFDNMRVYLPGIGLENSYVDSGYPDSADIDETVVFEYTEKVDEAITPKVTVVKDEKEIHPEYDILIDGNKVMVRFEELEVSTKYEVSVSGVSSFWGNEASEGMVEFTTSDYKVDVDSVSVSGDTVSANLKGTYKNGVEAYLVASAYDSEDNLADVDILPIEVPYREADVIEFTPEFDADYSYIKAMLVRNFEYAMSYSENAPSDFVSQPNEEADGKYDALKSLEIDGNTYTVYGENVSKEDSVITIQILRNGKTWDDLADFDYETDDITEILAGFDAVSGVGYGEIYAFTKNLADGEIPSFRVGFGDGSLAYYDPIFKTDINDAQTAEELSEVVKSFDLVWNEIEALVEELSDEEEELFWQLFLETKNNYAENGESISLPAQVTALAPTLSAFARVKLAGNATKVVEVFDSLKGKDAFATNSYDIYAGTGDFEGFGMSDSQKATFAEYIVKNKDDYTSVEDFTDDFETNAVLYAIKGGSKARIDKILTGSDLVDSDEFPTYAKLSNEKKKIVCEEIGTSKLFTSIAALEDAVEAESKAAKRANQESGGSGGGGGGGSSSSSVKGQSFVTIEKEDEAKVETLPFTDIANVEWAQKAITALADAKIVEGNGTGSFSPNNYVTREEFVKMLVLALGINTSSASESFDDIDSSDWCYSYVCAAVNSGIVNGIDTDTFGKGRVISREEMATMTYRALSKMGIMLGQAAKDDFADMDAISDWAKDACTQMHRAGIINGMGNNHFAPAEFVTRAQAAKILYEVITR